MNEPKYGFVKKLESSTFEDAVGQVTDALKAEGFGVLTEIDVQRTLKAKIDVDFRRYVILGACNPSLAHQALGVEPYIGLLLPCNVVVQELPGGGAEIAIADPKAMLAPVENADVVPIADEAGRRLRRVIAAL